MQKNRSIKPKIRWKAKKSPDVWQGWHQALEVQQALIIVRLTKLPPIRAAVFLRSFRAPSLGWGGANAPYKRFAAGKTLAQAELTSAEHFKIPGPHPGKLPGWARKKYGLKAARRAPQFSKR